MKNAILGMVGLALFAACLFTYVFQNVMFPATLAVAADREAQIIPGYEGEIAAWILRNDEGTATPENAYTASVLTPFDGYAGPTGFFSCGPAFIQIDRVVIRSRFHEDRGYDSRCHCQRFHTGIDYAMMGPDYSPTLLAPITGKVVFAGWDASGYGNLIVIENRGVRVYLAHLSRIGVGVGDIVGSGDELGNIGTTGNSSGPHLHFEVRVRDPGHDKYGLIVDPSTVLLPGESAPCDWSPGSGDYYIWKLH